MESISLSVYFLLVFANVSTWLCASSILIYIFGVILFSVCIYMSSRGSPVEGFVSRKCDSLGRNFGRWVYLEDLYLWGGSFVNSILFWPLPIFISGSWLLRNEQSCNSAIQSRCCGALSNHSTETTWSDDQGQ